jgi:hypothetical protein
MIEVRLGPDGWIAQLLPGVALAPRAWAEGRRWLQMSWANGDLQAELLADDQVADWQVIYRDESIRTDPRRPQRKVDMASLSQDLDPDEGSPR